jgi:hypothetical protein
VLYSVLLIQGDIQEKAKIFQFVRVNDVSTILLKENYVSSFSINICFLQKIYLSATV